MASSPLLLGGEVLEQFPGGLNRYVGELRAALDEAGVPSLSVLIGDGPGNATSVNVPPGPLPRRLRGIRRAVARELPSRDVLDAHFALYAAPVAFGRAARAKPFVFHFHGPWAQESAAVGERRLAVVDGVRPGLRPRWGRHGLVLGPVRR